MPNTSSQQVRVWDIAIRLFHWTLVLSFLIAYLTEDDWVGLHTNAGYLIGFLLLFRLVWGVVGSRYARFSNFIYRPSVVKRYLQQSLRFSAPRYLGHNPAGGVMVIALLLSLGITVITGIYLYGATDFAGPMAGVFSGEFAADLLEGLHEFFANFTLLLVFIHVGGVLYSSIEHGENLARAMLTGNKKEQIE
ncbi:MAG: cytochrome b/b6 domain-containing protein [Chromatiales bacterium]|jgi:cytochrome b